MFSLCIGLVQKLRSRNEPGEFNSIRVPRFIISDQPELEPTRSVFVNTGSPFETLVHAYSRRIGETRCFIFQVNTNFFDHIHPPIYTFLFNFIFRAVFYNYSLLYLTINKFDMIINSRRTKSEKPNAWTIYVLK